MFQRSQPPLNKGYSCCSACLKTLDTSLPLTSPLKDVAFKNKWSMAVTAPVFQTNQIPTLEGNGPFKSCTTWSCTKMCSRAEITVERIRIFKHVAHVRYCTNIPFREWLVECFRIVQHLLILTTEPIQFEMS